MRLFNIKFRKSVVLIWFFSIFVILSIILVLKLGIDIYSLGYLEQEVLHLYENSTNTLKTTVDMRLSGVETIVNEIGINSKNIYLMNSSGGEEKYLNYAYDLIQDLQAYSAANPLIRDIFVCYPNSGHIVGNTGIFGAQQYYYISDFKNSISASEWAKLISTPDTRQFDIIGNSTGGMMILKHIMPMNGGGRPKAIIIALVNQEEMEKILSTVKISVGPELTMLIYPNGQVYSYYGDEALLPQSKMILKTTSPYGNTHGYLVTKTLSNYGHFNYVVINRKSDVLTLTSIFRSIVIAGVFFCLLLGCSLAYYISKKNNFSIIEAVNSISKGKKRDTDEYTYVTSYLKNVISEKSNMSGQLAEQRLLIKRSLLVRLLKGDMDDETMKLFVDIFKESFFTPYFAVAVIYLEVPGKADNKSNEWREGETVSIAEKAISDCPELKAIVCLINGNIALVLNLLDKTAESELTDDVNAVVEVISKQVDLTVKVGIGGIYSLEGITLSYHEAVEALESTFENDGLKIARYLDTNKEAIDTLQPYTVILTRLDHAMKIKDYVGAEALIERIFTGYLNPSEAPDIFNCRKYAYINFLMDAVSELQERSKTVHVDMQAFFKAKTLWSLKAESLNVLNALKKTKERDDKSGSKKFAESVKHFIDENYSDPDMNLNLISNKMKVDHSQLSRLFKRQIGYGISEYINNVRIEAAKKLLNDSKLTLKEIAYSVGYSSDINFIRVFKKNENVTPRNYGK